MSSVSVAGLGLRRFQCGAMASTVSIADDIRDELCRHFGENCH